MLLAINSSSKGNKMYHAINSSSENINGKPMLFGGTYKTDLEVSPVLAHEWANLMACTPDEMGSVLDTLLK